MSETLSDPRIAEGMRAQTVLRQKLLDGGAKQIGWKVGFGAPVAMEKLRLTAPLVGFILDRASLTPGAAISLSGWTKPAAEAEIAAYIGRDLPAGSSRDEVRQAITALGPAIELADVNSPGDDVQAILTGDIFQRHVVLGPRDTNRSGARLDGLTGRVTRSGADVTVPANLEANTGEIISVVRHVANVAAIGGRLSAGQFVICGSLTAPMMLTEADSAVDFILDPIGAVSVRFTR